MLLSGIGFPFGSDDPEIAAEAIGLAPMSMAPVIPEGAAQP